MAEYQGESECHECGKLVHVSKNAGRRAYYHCGACGFKGEHMRHTTSDAYIKRRVRLASQPVDEAGKIPQKVAIPAAAAPVPRRSALDDYLMGGAAA